MASKAAPAANRAAICANCGWTNYPQPVLIPERTLIVEWQTPKRCDRCGKKLEPSPARS